MRFGVVTALKMSAHGDYTGRRCGDFSEFGSSMFLRNVGTRLQVHTALQHKGLPCNYIVAIYLVGQEVEVKRLSIRGLLPDTEYYMTYDGSTTMPACHETVTWVILNKPIYITKQQVGHSAVSIIIPSAGRNNELVD
jgi:hypothetical protein